ncbi:hypothetical protein HOY80DRAFT_948283, partial [Tuber brumale]
MVWYGIVSVSVFLDGLLAGRQACEAGAGFPGQGEEETRCFNTGCSEQQAGSRKAFSRDERKERGAGKSATHTLSLLQVDKITGAWQGPSLKLQLLGVAKPSKTPKRSHEISEIHVQEGRDGMTAANFLPKNRIGISGLCPFLDVPVPVLFCNSTWTYCTRTATCWLIGARESRLTEGQKKKEGEVTNWLGKDPEKWAI